MTRINDTPIKETLNQGGHASKAWNQWLASLGDALKGEWLSIKKEIPTSGITGSQPHNVFNLKGNTVEIDIEYASATASSATITLPYNLKDSIIMLSIFDTSWDAQAVEVVDNIINLPDFTDKRVIIKGTLTMLNSWQEKGA